MFSLLIFDLDGTLIDSRVDIALAVNLTLRDLGRPLLPVETIYGYVGNGVSRLLADATGSTDPDFLARTFEIFDHHYLTHLTDQTCLYSGIMDVLNHYQDKKKVVVTNKREKFTRKIIENLGITNRFELLICGDTVGPLKPDPGMILYALKQLNIQADEAIIIGDMENDIRAARGAGISVCAVGYGFGDAFELKKSQPNYFAETVREIVSLSF